MQTSANRPQGYATSAKWASPNFPSFHEYDNLFIYSGTTERFHMNYAFYNADPNSPYDIYRCNLQSPIHRAIRQCQVDADLY